MTLIALLIYTLLIGNVNVHYKAREREIKKFIIATFFVVAIANAYLAFGSM